MFGTKLAVGVRDRSWQIDLPPEFRGIEVNDYVSYLDLLGIAESRAEDEDLQKRNLSKKYNGISQNPQLSLPSALVIVEAWHSIIQGWPDSFISLLERIEIRSQISDEKRTPSQVFSTEIGRSLCFPCRGENGLPLLLIHSAFDAYRRERHGHRRSRNPPVQDVNIKRVCSLFNGTALARAMGKLNATPLHGRIVKRIVHYLTEKEKSFPPEELAGLLRTRSIALYVAASCAITPCSARRRLEGVSGCHRISGWDHPELLQPDLELARLRRIDKIYSEKSISDILIQLSRIAVRVKSPGTLLPLMSVAVRYRRKRPALTKTDLLLQIIRGALRVACVVSKPTLRDLYVDVGDLNVDFVARRARQSSSPYMSKTALDRLVTYHHGGVGILTVNVLHRLVRAGLVRSETRAKSAKNLMRQIFFHRDDVSAIMSRQFAGQALPQEIAVIGCEIEIGSRLHELYQNGLTKTAIATELNRLNIRTVRGALWSKALVEYAFSRSISNRVLAVVNSEAL